MGFVIGVREVVDEYDYDTDERLIVYENDRQFRRSNGDVFCKGGSVMFPKPPTHADGWEVDAIDDPYWFFQDLLDTGCVQEVYIMLKDNTKVSIWTQDSDWMSKAEMLRKSTVSFNKQEEVECEGYEVKPAISLQVLAGRVVLGDIGYESWKQLQYLFDRETYASVVKPVAWWVPV